MGAAIRASWRVGDVQGDAGRVASGRRYGGGGAATIRERQATCAAKVWVTAESPLSHL